MGRRKLIDLLAGVRLIKRESQFELFVRLDRRRRRFDFDVVLAEYRRVRGNQRHGALWALARRLEPELGMHWTGPCFRGLRTAIGGSGLWLGIGRLDHQR